MQLRAALIACQLAAACDATPRTQRQEPDAPDSRVEPAAVDAPPTGGAPSKWTCATDKDCMNSCEHGAVSVTWYAAANPAECEDGCANQLAEDPRCIAGSCVAFTHDPSDEARITENRDCTRRK